MKKVAISELQLIPVRFQEGLVFFANFVLDYKYFVGNVAVYTLKNGMGFRLVYPNKKLANGQQVSIFHPINNETGQQIQEIVSKEATKLLEITPTQLQGKYIFGSKEETD